MACCNPLSAALEQAVNSSQLDLYGTVKSTVHMQEAITKASLLTMVADVRIVLLKISSLALSQTLELLRICAVEFPKLE